MAYFPCIYGNGGSQHTFEFNYVNSCYGDNYSTVPKFTDKCAVAVSENDSNYTAQSYMVLDLTDTDLTGITGIRIALEDLAITDFGAFVVTPLSAEIRGEFATAAVLGAERLYTKTGEGGAVSESSYTINIPVSASDLDNYLYIGVSTGISENVNPGFEDWRNGSASAKIVSVDFIY